MDLRLLENLRGVVTISLNTVNTIFWFIPIIVMTFIKIVTPVSSWRARLTQWIMLMGENWISVNNLIFRVLLPIEWDIRQSGTLDQREWYLMISNHQSWVDIVALQKAFNRRTPFLKFFIKQILVWVPFLGQAWWAMDMPFMKRYTRAYLEKHPEKRGLDMAATRKACEKFSTTPTTVINFVEGTRFTEAKQADSKSPYEHLLQPRAGGVAFALDAMGGILNSLIDVTIVYPQKENSFWDFLCGRLRKVIIDIRVKKLDEWLVSGDYAEDEQFRARFQQWISGLWEEKDQLITSINAEQAPQPAI
ncbi:MAG: acyltransferase [Gammaproteobacteria bacterium]